MKIKSFCTKLISVNRLYYTGHKVLTKEARLCKEELLKNAEYDEVELNKLKTLHELDDIKLEVKYKFGLHNVKRSDVDNRIKSVQDLLISQLVGIDDCHIYKIEAEKYAVSKNEKEKVEIIINLWS